MVQNKTNTYKNLPSSPPDMIVKKIANNRTNDRLSEPASEFRPTIVELATFDIDLSEVGVIRKYSIEFSKKSAGVVKSLQIKQQNEGRFPGNISQGDVVFDRKEHIYTPQFLGTNITLEIEFETIEDAKLREELGLKTEVLILNLSLQKEFSPVKDEQNEDLLRETKRFLYFLVQSQAYQRGYFVSGGAIYDIHETAFMNGKVFKNGFILNVEEATVDNGKHKFTLQITPLKKLFRPTSSLLDYIKCMFGVEMEDMHETLCDSEVREELLKDISDMSVTSQNKTNFRVHGIQKSNEIMFFEKSIEPELVRLHNCILINASELQYPHLPLVVRNQDDNRSYYPFESLVIPTGQLVKPTPFNLDLIDDSIKEGQLLPHEHKKLVKDFKSTMLGIGNKYLNSFKVRITQNMTQIQANIAIPPMITYDWQTMSPIYTNVTDPTLSWNVKHDTPFTTPVRLSKWAIMVLDETITKEESSSFADNLRKTAWKHRMIIDTESYLMSNTSNNVKDLRRQGKELREENVQILIVIADKKMFATEELLRTVEVTTGIATHLFDKDDVLQVLGGKALTHLILPLQVINAKCNGINFLLDVTRGMCRDLKAKERLISKNLRRMYVGISIANGDVEKPTAIGLAYTLGSVEEQKSMIWYQPNKATCIEELAPKVMDSIRNYTQVTQNPPEEIVIFRRAATMETEKLDEEFNKIVHGIDRINSQHRPTITMISVVHENNRQYLRYKVHYRPSVRFSVVGSKTGCAPILLMNELKWITNALAYANQFTNLPGSVPSVVTAADCASSRALLAAKIAINEQLLNIPGSLKRKFEDVNSNEYYKEVTKQLKNHVEGRHW